MAIAVRPTPHLPDNVDSGVTQDHLTGLFEPKAGAGLELVLQATHAAAEIAEVQEYGCSAVRSAAAESRENQDRIAELHGIEIVVEAVKNHPTDEQVQATGCGALGNLAHEHEPNQLKIVLAGGIELAIKAMRAFGSSRDVQAWGAAALRHLTHNCWQGRAKATRGGATQTVLKAMKAFESDTMIQAAGSAMLGHLAHENSEDRTLVVGAGALAAILRSLELHPEVAKVQACGCAALGNLFVYAAGMADHLEDPALAQEDEINLQDEHDAQDGEGDGAHPARPQSAAVSATRSRPPSAPHEAMRLVVEAMVRHAEDVDVQACGAAALQGLTAAGQELRDYMAELNGMEAMMAAMVTFQTAAKVQSAGVIVLSRLCGDSIDNCARLAANPKAILTAMEALQDDLKVQEAAAAMVSRLAQAYPEWRLRLVEFGAVPLLLWILEAYSHEATLQMVACEAVRWCCELCPEGQASAAGNDGIAILLKSLDLQRQLLPSHVAGWTVLEALMETCVEYREEANRHGILPLAHECAIIHLMDPVVQRCCCSVASSLAGDAADSERRSELCHLGLLTTALEALSTHPEDASVQAAALEAGARLLFEVGPAFQAKAVDAGAIELFVAAVARHPEAAGVQCSGAAAIRSLLGDSEQIRRRFIALDTSDILLASVQTHLDFLLLQERTLLVLRCLADQGRPPPLVAVDGPLSGVAEVLESLQEEELDEDTDPMSIKRKHLIRGPVASMSVHLPTRLAARGAGPALLSSMRRFPKALEVQREAAALLWAIAAAGEGHRTPSGFSVRGQISQEDLVERMAEVMSDSDLQKCVDLQESACAVVCLVAANSSAMRVKFGEAGCIQLVLRVAKLHGSPELQVISCSALRALSLNSSDGQRLLIESGGIDFALTTMQDNADDPRVQVAGCTLMHLLAGNETSKEDLEIRRLLVANGALEAALQAMELHDDNHEVLLIALLLVSTLCRDGPEPRYRALRGGLARVLLALRFELADADTAERGCQLLDAYASDGLACRTQMLGEGCDAVPVAAACASQHPKRIQMQFYICSLVLKLATDSPESRLRTGELGGVVGVLDAMRAALRKVHVEACACNALMQLSTRCRENVNRIVEAKGIKAVCMSMFKSEEDQALQEAGCGALRFIMADSEETPDEVDDLGGLQIVMSAVERFPLSAGVQEHGLSCLANLCWHHPENQETVVLKEGIELSLNALRNHPDQPKVLAFACAALHSISNDHKRHREILGRSGAIPLIVEAMERHPDMANVQAYACAALQSMACGSYANKRAVIQAQAEDLAINAMEVHPRAWKLQEFAQMLLDTLSS